MKAINILTNEIMLLAILLVNTSRTSSPTSLRTAGGTPTGLVDTLNGYSSEQLQHVATQKS